MEMNIKINGKNMLHKLPWAIFLSLKELTALSRSSEWFI